MRIYGFDAAILAGAGTTAQMCGLGRICGRTWTQTFVHLRTHSNEVVNCGNAANTDFEFRWLAVKLGVSSITLSAPPFSPGDGPVYIPQHWLSV